LSIDIFQYSFEGPFTSTDRIEDRSGVYVILCNQNNGHYNVTDVGESATVKSRVENHDRRSCWGLHCNSKLVVAVLYTPNLHQTGRKQIEQEIRRKYNPPCGDR